MILSSHDAAQFSQYFLGYTSYFRGLHHIMQVNNNKKEMSRVTAKSTLSADVQHGSFVQVNILLLTSNRSVFYILQMELDFVITWLNTAYNDK